jgi:hypothetical protein
VASFNFVGLTFEALRWNPQGVDIALVFHGFYCLVVSYQFQVDLSAPNSGRADGVGRSCLADLSVTAARKLSVALQSGLGPPRGSTADAVAPRDGRQRSTMEGAVAGQRSGGTASVVRHWMPGVYSSPLLLPRRTVGI